MSHASTYMHTHVKYAKYESMIMFVSVYHTFTLTKLLPSLQKAEPKVRKSAVEEQRSCELYSVRLYKVR